MACPGECQGYEDTPPKGAAENHKSIGKVGLPSMVQCFEHRGPWRAPLWSAPVPGGDQQGQHSTRLRVTCENPPCAPRQAHGEEEG